MKIIKLIAYAVILILTLHVSAGEMNKNKKLYNIPTNCDFLEVGNNDSLEFDCTPKLTDRFFSEFRGILINTPKEIIWPANTSVDDYQSYPNGNNDSPLKFMLSGLARVPDSMVTNNSEVAYDVVVIAVNQKTAESYSGKMQQMGFIGAVPEVAPVAEPIIDITRTYYFNIDLIHNLGVPLSEASYTVYAVLGDYKSNVTIVGTKIQN